MRLFLPQKVVKFCYITQKGVCEIFDIQKTKPPKGIPFDGFLL